jgi:hypothetical protein
MPRQGLETPRSCDVGLHYVGTSLGNTLLSSTHATTLPMEATYHTDLSRQALSSGTFWA